MKETLDKKFMNIFFNNKKLIDEKKEIQEGVFELKKTQYGYLFIWKNNIIFYIDELEPSYICLKSYQSMETSNFQRELYTTYKRKDDIISILGKDAIDYIINNGLPQYIKKYKSIENKDRIKKIIDDLFSDDVKINVKYFMAIALRMKIELKYA